MFRKLPGAAALKLDMLGSANVEVTLELFKPRDGFLGLKLGQHGERTAVRVLHNQPNSAAAASGLKPFDRLISINGRAVKDNLEKALQLLQNSKAGLVIKLQVVRGSGPVPQEWVRRTRLATLDAISARRLSASCFIRSSW